MSLANEIDIESYGRIPFKDSFKFYQMSKIFVNTSLPDSDGLPNAYIQSWLSGSVVVSLNHNPNNWFEKHKIGYCANGDEKALKDYLKFLINNPEVLEQMSKNAKIFAEETFANSEILNNYKEILFNYAK